MLHEPKPILAAELFPEILEHLLSLLSGIDPADWRKPTGCEGWSVKDVTLNLLGVEVGNLSVWRDGHVASENVQDWDELVEFINAWNQDCVRVSRRISTTMSFEMLRFGG